MVCVLAEGSALCVIQDKMPSGSDESYQFHLSVSSTVEDLLSEVEKHFSYDPDSYELVLSKSGEDVKKKKKSSAAADIGVQFGAESRNTFVIIESKKHSKAFPAPSIVISYAQQSGEKDAIPENSERQDVECRSYSYRYVGLVNQAMTCYLNSLIQALYMTPEFRNALYKWEFIGSQDEMHKSIPYQLQRLFVSLQTSNRSAVETTKLTRSFGWDSSDSWQQHDIQELCRVMFDALEQKFLNTDQADFINKLYEGKMLDYVKCLECGTENTREDTFLDIPLPVRPFGNNIAYNSVEEAMMAFVQPETLDGNNQYFCEKCDKKCDAHKGLKFSRFPYVLTLHLKRFDFDYSNMQRIKLTDRVEFPQFLNINKFISHSSGNDTAYTQETHDTIAPKDDDVSITDVGCVLEDEGCQSTDAPENMHGSTSGSNSSGSNVDIQDYDEGIDVSNSALNHHQQESEKNHRKTEASGTPGPYIYELFSIMIHSGSASGGHYYAYIKDFNKGEWFCFNDQSVNRITTEDIYKTYGGGVNRTYFSGAHSSSTSAYMLMYRQFDKKRNVAAMTVEEFPPHLQELMMDLKKDEEAERSIREREKDRIRIKIYARHPRDGRLQEQKLFVNSDTTLADATSCAHSLFSFEDIIPLEQCRLVSYNTAQETIECSFDSEYDELVIDLLSRLPSSSSQHSLLLETREANAQFETYRLGGVVLKVYRVNMDSGEVDPPVDVPSQPTTAVNELRPPLARAVKLSQHLRIMMEKYGGSPVFLDDDKTLESSGFCTNNKIFVAPIPENGLDTDFDYTMSKIVERFGNTITLYCTLPCCDKESLAKLGITPTSSDGNKAQNGDPESACDMTRGTSPQLPALDGEEEGTGATGCSDQSTSEDSSLTDSDRTIVGYEADYCLAELSSSSPSPQGSDQPNLSSPDDEDVRQKDSDAWNTYGNSSKSSGEIQSEMDSYYKDIVLKLNDKDSCNIPHQYLKIFPCEGQDQHQMVRVQVDKRLISLHLKSALAHHLGVSPEFIKLFRKCGSTEMEYKLNDQLSAFRDEEHIYVRLERALRKGEFRGKVYQLSIDYEPEKYLCDWIITKDMTVGEAKRQILEELKKKDDEFDLPLEKCRLRAKKWKDPGKIFLDSQSFQELKLKENWELFLQELPEGEVVTDTTQVTVLLRRVFTPEARVEEFHEITLTSPTYEELSEKVSQFSGIPCESLRFARPFGCFPHTSSLDILNDLQWDVCCKCILEDGTALFYRDLNDKPLQNISTVREHRRVRRNYQPTNRTNFSGYPKKERALKIYVDSTPQPVKGDFESEDRRLPGSGITFIKE